MKNKLNKIQSKKIIEKSILALGLKETKKTNPQIIKTIIEEFKLDDLKTKNKVMQKFFHDSLTQPQELKQMINCIKKSIVLKHPGIVEFLNHAINKKWLKPSENIIKALHVTFVLEALTVVMCNDHDFFIEVKDHYKLKEKQMGINPLHSIRTLMHAFGITHNLFGTIKALSVDPAMIYFRTQRGLTKSYLNKNKTKQLLKQNKINYIEYILLLPIHKKGLDQANKLLRINIYEAGITEYKNGFISNAICAHELNEDIIKNSPSNTFKVKNVIPQNVNNSFYSSICKKNNLFPVFQLSKQWISLYITWNMSFMLGNVNNLDIMLPKLIIPSIIAAEDENFLGARIISLWLSVNHYFYRKYDKGENVDIPNQIKMAKAWGNINKKYAFKLAKKETHEDAKILLKGFNQFFSHPFLNWMKLTIKLLKNKKQR